MPSPTCDRGPRPALATVLLAVILVLVARWPLGIGHDAAMYLQAGALLVDGEVPYVDFVDLNPPLIVYLSALPAALARALGAHPAPVFLLLVWLATAASVLATYRWLCGGLEPPAGLHADLVALVLAGMSLWLLWSDLFGQREHLFALALVPYLVARHRTWCGHGVSAAAAVAAGVLAGVGASLKPHFVAIAIAPEVYFVLTRRRFAPLVAPETVGLVGAGLAYAAHFLVIPSAMRDAFFGRWLALTARGYHVYDRSPWVAIPMLGYWAPPILAAGVFIGRRPRGAPAWDLARALAVATLVAVLVFFVQRKLWDYHAIPAQFLFGAVAALALAEGLPSRSPRGEIAMRWLGVRAGWSRTAARGAVAVLAVAAAVLACGAPVERNLAEILETQPLARAIAAHSAPGDPVLIVVTSVQPTYPLLLQLGRRPGSRLLWFFPLPMLYADATARHGAAFPYRVDPTTVPPEESRLRRELREDVAKWRPPLVLIDAGAWCLGCPLGFRVLEYLERTGVLEAALADYRRAGEVESFAVFLSEREIERSDRMLGAGRDPFEPVGLEPLAHEAADAAVDARARVGPRHQDRVDVEHVRLLDRRRRDTLTFQPFDKAPDRIAEHLVAAVRDEGGRKAAQIPVRDRHARVVRVEPVQIGPHRDVPRQDVAVGVRGDRGLVERHAHLGREQDQSRRPWQPATPKLERQRGGEVSAARVAGHEQELGRQARRQHRLVHGSSVEQARRVGKLRCEAIVGHDHAANGLACDPSRERRVHARRRADEAAAVQIQDGAARLAPWQVFERGEAAEIHLPHPDT
jgi:hypothetical protein